MKKLIFFAITFLAYTGEAGPAFENRKRIVVIDTGIGAHLIHRPYICRDSAVLSALKDAPASHVALWTPKRLRHGENVIGIIGRRIDVSKYCIVSIRFWDYGKSDVGAALEMANQVPNVVAVNMSLSGFGEDLGEKAGIKKLLDKGVIVMTAAGNDNLELTRARCFVYPACYKTEFPKLVVVAAPDVSSSNHSKDLEFLKVKGTNLGIPKMSGTSQATALFTGSLFN